MSLRSLLGRGFTRKNQVFFSSKEKSKKIKCRLLQYLFGALRVKDSILICRLSTFIFGAVGLFYVFVWR